MLAFDNQKYTANDLLICTKFLIANWLQLTSVVEIDIQPMVMHLVLILYAGLLTGCGKKRKLCGFCEANCAVKNGDCAGIVRDCAIV